MRIKIVMLILIIVPLYSCSEQNNKIQNDDFVINGEVKGISDSSWVFLQNNEKLFDSALVLNNKFKLTGKVDEPTNIFIIIKSTMDYKSLWVENNIMTFKAQSGKFLDALITGSETQLEADKYWEKIRPIRKQRDSLKTMLKDGKGQKNLIQSELEKLEKQNKEIEINYVRENPNSLLSIYMLEIYKTTWGEELVSSLFTNLSKKLKMTDKGKSIKKYIELGKNPKIGDHFIDFTEKNVNDKEVKLSDIKAKVILLDFWGAYCTPCRYENKNLVKTYEEFNSKGFEILGVSGDSDKGNWLKAIEEDGLIWENLRNENGKRSDPFLIYGITGVPENFLINSEGIIIARDLRGEDLIDKLKEIL